MRPELERRLSLTHGYVDAVGLEVGQTLRCQDPQLDVGIRLCEAWQAGDEPLRGKGRRHADRKPLGLGAQRRRGIGDQFKGPPQLRGIASAGSGQG